MIGPDDVTTPCAGHGCDDHDADPHTALCDECDTRFDLAGEHAPECRCEECVWWMRTARALGLPSIEVAA